MTNKIKIHFIQLCRLSIILFPVILIILISSVFQERIIIESIVPEESIAIVPFNEFNGEAALEVKGSGFMSSDVIYINGTPQSTTFGNNTLLTCIVDRSLYQEPGKLEVKVLRKDGEKVLQKSNKKYLNIISN